MHLTRSIALLCTLLVPPAAPASDWPGWRGPARTGAVPSDEPVPTNLPQPAQVVWKVPVGYAIASPIVIGPAVIYLDNQQNKEVVHAVDRATGKELWSDVLDDVHKDSQSAPGPRCTPVADAQRVYAQSGRGTLHCLALPDGKLLWQKKYVTDFGATFIGEKGKAAGATRHGYTATPLVDGDHLLVEAGGSPDSAIVCLEKTTGNVIWKAERETPAYAAPMLATIDGTRQMVAFMIDGVIGLDPADGKLLWRYPITTSLGRHAATPVIAGDRVVVSSHEAGLIGLRIARQPDGTWTAAQEWGSKNLAINFASPVLAGHHLYGVGPSKNLICVDVKGGQPAWSKEGFFTGNPGKAYAGMIVMGKNVLTLTDDGQLVLFAADPSGYKEVSRVRVCGKNWCIPAYADGRLYLRDEKELICLQLLP